MAIKPSASAEVRALIEALSGEDAIKREAAVARLAVLGARAVDRLAAAYTSAPVDTRVAILRVFEAAAEPRAVPIAREGLRVGGDLGVGAVGVLRSLLDSRAGTAGAEALDALVATALDRQAERRVRLAALDALRDMPTDVQARITSALDANSDLVTADRDSDVQRQALAMAAIWRDALDGHLAGDPEVIRQAARARAETAPLGEVQKLIELVRERESRVHQPQARQWQAVRGALHQALALRGSTVAVYDLRETIAASDGPLPQAFVSTLHAVGDQSCLEAIAAAWAHAPDDDRWRQQLTGAFHAIVKRERLSRRHASLKRIETRWPEAAGALSMPSRTRPRSTTRGRT